MTGAAASLARRIAVLHPDRGRALVALAGPPGAGKSTFAEALVGALGTAGRPAALVPMDGFHLDNRLLEARGLMARKGAPGTFDADGLAALLPRLAGEDEVIFPLFDRSRDIAIAGAGRVGPEHRVAVVEGNYLLLDSPPWRGMAAQWTLSVRLDVPEAVLEDRLLDRWRAHGLTAADARARAEGNDLPNARTVADRSAPADLTLRWADGDWSMPG